MKRLATLTLILLFVALSNSSLALADSELKIVDADTLITFELRPVVVPTAPFRPGNLFLGTVGAEETWNLKSVEVKTVRRSTTSLFIGGADALAMMNLNAPHAR